MKILEIAEYFIWLTHPEVGEIITGYKLHKLLYYAQGYHLALFDKPLFKEEIIALENGPYIKLIAERYSYNQIKKLKDIKIELLSQKELSFIQDIQNICGSYAVWKLDEMIKKEKPWLDNYNKIIPHKDLKDFFKEYIKN